MKERSKFPSYVLRKPTPGIVQIYTKESLHKRCHYYENDDDGNDKDKDWPQGLGSWVATNPKASRKMAANMMWGSKTIDKTLLVWTFYTTTSLPPSGPSCWLTSLHTQEVTVAALPPGLFPDCEIESSEILLVLPQSYLSTYWRMRTRYNTVFRC